MNSITLKSRAKINLSIDVLGKRQDGYHLVEMIMQTIDLYDLIEINEKDNDQITIKSTSDEIPLDCNNLVYKAANLIKKRRKFECRSCISRVKQTLEFKFK